ncbi:MAG: DUF4340 domain-containing protein [Hyphomicrobiaceae bacterium]|nr:DUF4340 domain-containing protein [Hyphomicrobiaceae bacterium]
MEPKHFNMLAVAAVVSLITAGIVHGAYNNWQAEKVTGQKLFEGFDKGANKVGRVMLQKGKAKLTLQKDGKGWVVLERSGYPVDSAKVRALLVNLANTELVEPKTRVASRYSLLELGDPARDDAKSTLVALADERGKAIADVVIGKRKPGAFGQGKPGTYIRRPGNPQSWLASANLRASVDVVDWVDPVFFRLDPKTVTSLTIAAPKGQPFELVPDEKKKGEFKFKAVPEGHKLKAGASASGMVKAMRTLELMDVKKIKAQPDGDKVTKATLVTAAGAKIDIRLRADNTDRWLSIKVVDAGKDEAIKKLAPKIEGWEFKVADWRSRQTFKTPSDVFEPIKKPENKPVPPKAGAPQPPRGPEPAAGPSAAPK